MRGVGNSLFTIAMGLDQICYNIIFETTYLFLAMVWNPKEDSSCWSLPRDHTALPELLLQHIICRERKCSVAGKLKIVIYCALKLNFAECNDKVFIQSELTILTLWATRM